jgi:hypothetical protein
MKNKFMYQLVAEGEAIDVSVYPINSDGDYILPPDVDVEGKDLCNLKTDQWIWAVGKRKKDGVILASLIPKFYLDPKFECIWLR